MKVYTFQISVVLEDQDDPELVDQAIGDAVCEFFGGHSVDSHGENVCPRGWVSTFLLEPDEEPEVGLNANTWDPTDLRNAARDVESYVQRHDASPASSLILNLCGAAREFARVIEAVRRLDR